MNLDLSDDQRMLKDSVDRFVAERYAFEHRARVLDEPEGWSRALWGELAGMGLLMLPFAEADGGLGLGAVETMLVGEAFGRALVVEPYLPSIVLAGGAIARFGSAAQRGAWLPGLISGERIGCYADRGTVRAERLGDGWLLTGAVDVVLGGGSADLLIVRADAGLFVLEVTAQRLMRRGYRLHGGGGGADFVLDGVVVGEADRLVIDGAPDIIVEAGIAFLAAEASGAMAAALDLTVDYLKTREQFGRPIGANQALRHRAAEMLMEVEQARSAALYAALLAAEPDPTERAKGYAAVKAVIGKAARFVGQQTVQLHGGIGVSEEHAASHYFRRLTAIGLIFGDAESHIERLARLGGFTGAALHGA